MVEDSLNQINLPPERFLALLREAHPVMVPLFMRGGCYQLFLILRELWPGALPWYDWREGHVYTEIDNKFYDIRGQHAQLPKTVHRLDQNWPNHRPHRWQCPWLKDEWKAGL